MEIEKKAYNQIIGILDNLKESEYAKIPERQISLLEERKDPDYTFYYDTSKSLKQNKVLPDTICLLVALWDMYIATDKQHEKLSRTLLEKDFEDDQNDAIKLANKVKYGRRKANIPQTKIKIDEMQGDIIIDATEEEK